MFPVLASTLCDITSHLGPETQKVAFSDSLLAPALWLDPGDPVPVCPDCGKPFKKQEEILGKISYIGDCVEVHLPERERRPILPSSELEASDVHMPDIGPGDPIPDLRRF